MKKKCFSHTLKLLVKTLFLLLVLVPQIAQAQRGDLTEDERRRASPKVQARLQKSRQLIGGKKLNYRVGLTPVSELDLKNVTGEWQPPDLLNLAAQQNKYAAAKLKISVDQLSTFNFSKLEISNVKSITDKSPVLEIDKFGNKTDKSKPKEYALGKSEADKQKTVESKPPCFAGEPFWDARSYWKIPPVRDQGKCGSCWVFAPQGLFEIARWNVMVVDNDTSEQFTFDLSNGGSCDGGYAHKAFDFLTTYGGVSEFKVPYKAVKGTSDLNLAKSGSDHLTGLTIWGFVSSTAELPSVAEIKKAICAHKAVVVSMYASDEFLDYTGGVWGDDSLAYENAQKIYVGAKTNHAVILLGWDDSKKAWLVRNSWGANWGENGYAWVRYGSSSIGVGAKWAH